MNTIPTLEDARKLAASFVDNHGVSMVLLFGSLARGDGNTNSDIDLVAVYDDLNYRERANKFGALSATADKVSNLNVDLWVTDRPEWYWRSERMSTTFEAGIKNECLKLCEADTQEGIRWGKEIGLPMTEQDDIRSRLQDCIDELRTADDGFTVSPYEIYSREDGDKEAEAADRYRRIKKTAASLTMSIDAALKLLVALQNQPPPATHKPWTLIRLLPQPLRSELYALIPEEDNERIMIWRQAGTYSSVMDLMELDETGLAEETLRYADTAITLSAVATREYEKEHYPDKWSNKLRSTAAKLTSTTRSMDLLSGTFVEEHATDQPLTFLQRFRWLRTKPRSKRPESQSPLILPQKPHAATVPAPVQTQRLLPC